jgi:NAD(P)-dependent dehydrogenase (short-subunit alcohol dehydrogenase family)
MRSIKLRRRFLGALLGCLLLTGFAGPAWTAEAAAPTVLITGANRGIGLALTEAYLARGWEVIATCRQPGTADVLQSMTREYPGLSIEQLDVLDYAMIDGLAEKLRGQPIDILINNAGIRGPRDQQSFGALNYSSFEPVMATNTLAPLKMAEAFIEHVAGSEQKKIITISSSLGSISRTFGGSYFYRASKTAVNMMMANLAKDVQDRGVIVGIVTPGYVDTDFTRGAGDQIPKISPEESAAGMLPVIDAFSLETSGTLMRHTGEPLTW